MNEGIPSTDIAVPKVGEWPGVFESYKLVKPYIQPAIWNFVSVVGIGIILSLVSEIIFGAIFKNTITTTILDDLTAIVIGAYMQAVILCMYFEYFKGKELNLSNALRMGYEKLLKMTGLIIIMYVVLLASLVLLIIPFFFVLPRVYLAPYFLIYGDCNINEAIAASWHSTKGNMKKVYGIFGLDFLIALLFLTIIGIPFAIYFGLINSGSFALLTIYLSQKKVKKLKAAKA